MPAASSDRGIFERILERFLTGKTSAVVFEEISEGMSIKFCVRIPVITSEAETRDRLTKSVHGTISEGILNLNLKN